MANTYDINKINILVNQLKLKDTLKKGDKIYIDPHYLTNIQTTLQNHGIEYVAEPMSIGGYEIKITRNRS